ALRFNGTKSSLVAINIGPSLVYAPNETYSIAIGPDFQKAELELNTAILNGVKWFVVPPAEPNPIPAEGHNLQRLKGTSYGYHLALLYTPVAGLDVGLHYRSAVDYTGKGRMRTFLTNPDDP